MVGVIRWWSYTFFDKLGGTIIKKDMAIPPEYRPVLKMGDFNTPLCFQKKTAALICDFKTAVRLLHFVLAHEYSVATTTVFLYAVIAENTYSLISFLVCLTSTTILEILR